MRPVNVEWILSGLRASVCGLLIAAYGMPALAEAPFPSRPVTTLVPYPAGGAVDAFVRTLAEALRVEWKTGIVVDNRPGANEIIASAALAKARPDGYTLMASTEAATILNPLLFKKLPYDVKEIAPISILVRAPLVLAVPVNSTTNTLKEFIALARARAADPVRYGSAGTGGTGGTGHLPFIQFARDHGLQLIHVPYRGGGPLLQDLLGGQVEAGLLESLDPFGFVAVGSDAAAYAEHTRNEAAAQRKRIESAGIRLDL